MRRRSLIRSISASLSRASLALLLFGHAALLRTQPGQAASASATVLDRVVAVVNNHAILSSDIEEEIRLSVLDPSTTNGSPALTHAHALDLLISRTLIQQQIHRENAKGAVPSQADIDARIGEIRKVLPACANGGCSTDQGWNVFLSAHGLTPGLVEIYLRNRIEILGFIEQRFRPGIRVSPEEIETYYRQSLLPLYAAGANVPPLNEVSQRIEEILLQKQVNVMFDAWLKNLREQGDVEVLDPAFESPDASVSPGEDHL